MKKKYVLIIALLTFLIGLNNVKAAENYCEYSNFDKKIRVYKGINLNKCYIEMKGNYYKDSATNIEYCFVPINFSFPSNLVNSSLTHNALDKSTFSSTSFNYKCEPNVYVKGCLTTIKKGDKNLPEVAYKYYAVSPSKQLLDNHDFPSCDSDDTKIEETYSFSKGRVEDETYCSPIALNSNNTAISCCYQYTDPNDSNNIYEVRVDADITKNNYVITPLNYNLGSINFDEQLDYETFINKNDGKCPAALYGFYSDFNGKKYYLFANKDYKETNRYKDIYNRYRNTSNNSFKINDGIKFTLTDGNGKINLNINPTPNNNVNSDNNQNNDNNTTRKDANLTSDKCPSTETYYYSTGVFTGGNYDNRICCYALNEDDSSENKKIRIVYRDYEKDGSKLYTKTYNKIKLATEFENQSFNGLKEENFTNGCPSILQGFKYTENGKSQYYLYSNVKKIGTTTYVSDTIYTEASKKASNSKGKIVFENQKFYLVKDGTNSNNQNNQDNNQNNNPDNNQGNDPYNNPDNNQVNDPNNQSGNDNQGYNNQPQQQNTRDYIDVTGNGEDSRMKNPTSNLVYCGSNVVKEEIRNANNEVTGYVYDGLSIRKIPTRLVKIVNIIIRIIYIGVPIVLIILGMIDFGKAVVAQKEDEMSKAQKVFIKRLITAVLVFIVVIFTKMIIRFVNNSTDNDSIMDCVDCFISGRCHAEQTTNK